TLIPGEEPHGKETEERCLPANLKQWVYPAERAADTASGNPAPSSAGSCASELISNGTPAAHAIFRNSWEGYSSRQSLRSPAVLISNATPLSTSAAIAGS